MRHAPIRGPAFAAPTATARAGPSRFPRLHRRRLRVEDRACRASAIARPWCGTIACSSPPRDPDTAELIVLCFDLATGDELWQRRFPAAAHPKHSTNSFATSTPARRRRAHVFRLASGKRSAGALTHDGDDVWQRDVGHLDEEHGFGASPMLVGDVVCIYQRHDGGGR